jgi:Mg-chelatase subunit ChlD
MADADKLPQAKRGTLKFFLEAWQRDYAVGVITFASRAWCLLSAGKSIYALVRRLERVEPNGRTAMASAVTMAVRRLRRRRGQRRIVLITDGMPDSREATLFAVRRARSLGIEVIAVGTDGADWNFLAALTPRPELAVKVPNAELESAIGAAADMLPRKG